jgi:ABC-type transporter Mla MlaB component
MYAVCEREFAHQLRSVLRSCAPRAGRRGSDGVEHQVETDGVTLVLSGRLDFAAAQLFRRLCEPAASNHNAYLVDLSAVTEIYDSGLSLLLMLIRHARRRDALLGFIDSHAPDRFGHQLDRVLRAATDRNSEPGTRQQAFVTPCATGSIRYGRPEQDKTRNQKRKRLRRTAINGTKRL